MHLINIQRLKTLLTNKRNPNGVILNHLQTSHQTVHFVLDMPLLNIERLKLMYRRRTASPRIYRHLVGFWPFPLGFGLLYSQQQVIETWDAFLLFLFGHLIRWYNKCCPLVELHLIWWYTKCCFLVHQRLLPLGIRRRVTSFDHKCCPLVTWWKPRHGNVVRSNERKVASVPERRKYICPKTRVAIELTNDSLSRLKLLAFTRWASKCL